MSAPTRAEFRDEVRSFFDTVLPGVLDGVTGTIPRAEAWRAALFDQGLGAIDHPVETGGRGLSGEYRQIYQDERRGRVPARTRRSGSVSAWPCRRSATTGPRRSASGSCGRGCAATRSGARCTPSRARGPTSPRSPLGPTSTVTSGSCRVRRSGRPAPSTVSSRSCSQERTGMRPSTVASPCSCCRWIRTVSRFARWFR